MRPATAFLWLNVLVFAAYGISALAAPAALLAGAGVQLAPASSTVDLRAIYGGAQLGFALFLVVCMGRAQVGTGLWAVILLVGGALGGRLLGLALEPGAIGMLALAGVEAVWLVFALGLLWLHNRNLRVAYSTTSDE